QYGFDGIDIDWEYPGVDTGMGNVVSPSDGANFTLLLQEFRTQFAAIPGDRICLLSIAAPAGKDKYSKLELAKISGLVDFINLMNYDYAGSWTTTTGHQSNLYPYSGSTLSTDASINDYIAAGFDPSKIVLGYPTYGRG